jgi:carbon monoxide dehydrogenase subunit G
MKITQQFNVDRDPDTVWDFFQDVPAVAQCLPGAELTAVNEDGTYDGQLSVKLGPMTAAFEGTATVSPDPTAKSAAIEGKGVDKRGGSRGQVKLIYKIEADGAGSRVDIDADLTISGPAAQFGRTGLINEISKRLIGDFVDCLDGKLAATTQEEAATISAKEVRPLSLFFGALWSWIKKLFGRG